LTFSFAFRGKLWLPRSPKITFIVLDERAGREQHRAKPFLVTDEEEHHFCIDQKKMGKRVEKIRADNLIWE
jgi:hypothetical protein